ncbi:uncharacterized protein LOC124697708 [Lolium rigidum]|uniref:uncharacterized protein LOC124697708 n=1 Tax=Lolium rigidum TaxID=89674 RepID=UPI001F5D64C5|nr:uncharacterized protein LOC124697708 [Lolium rigidum]
MAAAAYREWPLLPDDITRDIFARIQPDDPLYFFRVSHLCKDWRRALSDPDFAHRLHQRNLAPLLFGFLHDRDHDEDLPTFFRTLASPFSPKDVPDRRHWRVLDYRHGRALFISKRDGQLGRKDLLIWDPVTGVQRRVPVAPQASRSSFPGAAVVCAAPGCNHRPGCNGGDFQVALLFSDDDPQFDDEADEQEAPQIKGFLYSSQSDTWAGVATFYGLSEFFGERPSVLLGRSLYFLSDGCVILEFDMSANTLSEIALPDIDEDFCETNSSLILVHDQNGGIGIVEATDGNICIWSRDTRDDGDVSWSITWTFYHSDLHGTIGIHGQSLLGFVEGSSVIFVGTSEGIFTFDLISGLAKMVAEKDLFTFVLPVFNLCAPLNGRLQQIQVEQLHEQPKPNEEEKCEGGIKVAEDALQVAGHLFIKGWNDVENRDFNSAVQCLRDCLEIRTGHYGKFAPECASTYCRYGCALLYKAQEMTNLVDDEGGYLSLSNEMLDIARSIVEKNPESTMGIVSALTEVLIQREKKGAALTKSTETKTESIKRANVKETSPETPRKRHQTAADSVDVDRSSDDSGMHSPTQSDY